MTPLKLKRIMVDQANAAVAARKSTSALARTGQVSRSTVAVGDDDVLLDDVLVGAVDTTIETGAQAENIAFLDDDQVDSFDAVLAAGDAADVDAVLDAQEAEPDLGAEWEASADADDEAHAGRMAAIGVVAEVDEAHAVADQAAQDALKAQQTADGRNRIYAQAINPVAVPENPFVNGDLWYRTEVVGGVTKFAEVFMWNGTEWKPYQLVASSILVPGTVGNLLLEDGGISGTKLAFDAIYGKTMYGNEIYGALIDGSKIRLSGLTDTSTVVNDNGASLTSWTGQNGTALALDASVFETGTRSIRATRQVGNNVGVTRAFVPVTSALTATFRVRTPVDTTLVAIINRRNTVNVVEAGELGSPVFVPANTWTSVTVSASSIASPLSWVSVSLIAQGVQPATVWIDNFQLKAGAEDLRSVEVTRSANGEPSIWGFGPSRKSRFTLRTGNVDNASGSDYGELALIDNNESHMCSVSPYRVSWGAAGALLGYISRTVDADMQISAQGKNISMLSPVGFSSGQLATQVLTSWDSVKRAGFYFSSTVTSSPISGWVQGVVTVNEINGRVVQEVRAADPAKFTAKYVRHWDGSVWSAWQGDTNPGDTDWANAVLAPGVTGIARWRRFGGNTVLEFSITTSTAVAADGLLNPAFTIPPAQIPAAGAPLTVLGGGTRPAIGRMSPANGDAIMRNTHTSTQTQFVGGGNWLST